MIFHSLSLKKYCNFLFYIIILLIILLISFYLQNDALGQAEQKEGDHVETTPSVEQIAEQAKPEQKEGDHVATTPSVEQISEQAKALLAEKSKLSQYSKRGGGGEVQAPNLSFQNNNPTIAEFKFIGYGQIEKDHYSCYFNETLFLSYIITDPENNGIVCHISTNDSNSFNKSSNTYSDNFPYLAYSAGILEFNLSVKDSNGGINNTLIYLDVNPETKEKHFAQAFPPKAKRTTQLIIILLIIIKTILYYITKKGHLMGLDNSRIWEYIKYTIIVILILFVSNADNVNFLDFVYYIYLLLLIFSICFFELVFSSFSQGKIFVPQLIEKDVWRLSIPTPNSPMIEDFVELGKTISLKQKINFKEIFYYLKDSSLTFIVIFGMYIAVSIVGFWVPLDFRNVGPDMRYYFIFYYYSAVIALFGTILSIVAMFTIWHLQEKNQALNKSAIVIKIKNFMFLYISVIIISLGGLALVKYPNLDVLSSVGPVELNGSIFAFEVSMLLIIPAMAALFRLASWLMELNDNQNK